ncbi:MAG: O-antigen ligase family protein [Erysipelotrichaceae bacterium]|nr:O-antigen ligase family protein [Erysipelotrichaceae bacterium]
MNKILISNNIVHQKIDDIIVFLVVTSIFSFASITWFKLSVLAFGVCYVLGFKTLKFSKNTVWLLAFILLNYIIALVSSNPTEIMKATFDRLALYMIAIVIITSIYHDIEKTNKNVSKLIIMIVVNTYFILIMHIPKMIMAENILRYRINGYTYLNLVYIAANAMSFMIFASQLLLIYLYNLQGYFKKEPKSDTTKKWFKSKWFFIIIQLMLTVFAIMTFSRGYYVFWVVFLGTFLIVREYRINKFRSKVIWVLLGSGLVLVLIFLILRSNMTFIDWLSKMHQETSPKYVLHRFISLLKIIFTQNYIVDGSTFERINLMRLSWNIFVENPWVGVGLGTFHLRLFAYLQNGIYVYSVIHSHIDLFEIISATGIIGGILYYGNYVSLLKAKRKNIFFISLLLTVMIAGLFYMKFYNMYFWWLLVTLMGIDQGEYHEIK